MKVLGVMPVQQALYPLSHLPSSVIVVFNIGKIKVYVIYC